MKNYWTSEHELDILSYYRWYTFTVLQISNLLLKSLHITAKVPPPYWTLSAKLHTLYITAEVPSYYSTPFTLLNTLRKTAHPLHYCWSQFILQHTFNITEHPPHFCTHSALLLEYPKSQNTLNITALVPPHY